MRRFIRTSDRCVEQGDREDHEPRPSSTTSRSHHWSQRKTDLEEAEKVLTSLEAPQGIAKRICRQVAADHKTSADAGAKELKALAAEDNAGSPS